MLNSTKQPKPPTLKDSEPFDLFLIILFCLLSACTVKYYAEDMLECWNSYTDTCVGCIDDCLEPMKGE